MGCSVKCERLNRSLQDIFDHGESAMGGNLLLHMTCFTSLPLSRYCSGKLKTGPPSGHKWCLRVCSHHIPPGSRGKPASSKGYFSCPLWQVVRLLQINCCNYCGLQFPDLLKLYLSPSQACRALLASPLCLGTRRRPPWRRWW